MAIRDVPNIDKFGNYDMVNQGWKYNIHAENGQVVSYRLVN